ncbi:MAG: hypothetical protein R2883_01920 [Caldisericia bacterium]
MIKTQLFSNTFKVETDTYDVKKWTILNIIGSGELFLQNPNLI